MLSLITLAKLLLIIGGITFGIVGAANINIIRRVVPNAMVEKIVYILIGLSALLLMFNRNFYLPFLDKTVMPKQLLDKDKAPLNATFSVEVKVAPNSRVIYWASDISTNNAPVEVAYGEFENSGITTADSNGKAHLVLKKPESYVVKKGLFNRKLKPHIHYRYSLSNGMMSEIHTYKLNKNESFEDVSNKSVKCDCPFKNINLHTPGCQFSQSLFLDSVKSIDENASVSSQSTTTNVSVEKNRSLEHILDDRNITSYESSKYALF